MDNTSRSVHGAMGADGRFAAMSVIKRLAGETAIYGIPSILGRFINFLLVFFFVNFFDPDLLAPQIEFYAYAGFFFVVLPHGMETAFFNFSRQKEAYRNVFATGFASVATVSALFAVVLLLNRQAVGDFVGYPDHLSYVMWFAVVMAIDGTKSIPYALLRYLHRAKRFAFIKSMGIVLNVGLNIFFMVFYPGLTNTEPNIEFVFISNVLASAAELLLLSPFVFRHWGRFDMDTWKIMIKYSWPLVILGFAGMINETFDRIAMRHLLPAERAQFEIGIYGTFYRLSMIMTIFIQAFRYAAEPFFFAHADKNDARPTYAKVMNYFVWVCGVIFLGTALFKEDIASLLIRNEAYFNHPDALRIVPVLLLANMFLGIFYNLSIWYKLNDKTLLGALITLVGAVLTISMLIVYVPKYGFFAAAVTTMVVYGTMALISYFMGRRYYPVPYEVGKIILLIISALLMYYGSGMIELGSSATYLLNSTIVILYTFVGYRILLSRRKV